MKWLAGYTGTSVQMIEVHYGRWLQGDASQMAPAPALDGRVLFLPTGGVTMVALGPHDGGDYEAPL